MIFNIKAIVKHEAEKGTYLNVLIPDEYVAAQLKKLTYTDIMTGELRIDDARRINALQRKKAYATIKDIANYSGDVPESTKENMKYEFMIATGEDYFSLSSCSITTARLFINFMLDFAVKWGIPLSEPLTERCDDVTAAIYSCLLHSKCVICGDDGELHHWDTIGMGRNRNKIDDSKLRKLCLCRKHHNEAHNIGVKSFEEKYHVYGIIF